MPDVVWSLTSMRSMTARCFASFHSLQRMLCRSQAFHARYSSSTPEIGELSSYTLRSTTGETVSYITTSLSRSVPASMRISYSSMLPCRAAARARSRTRHEKDPTARHLGILTLLTETR